MSRLSEQVPEGFVAGEVFLTDELFLGAAVEGLGVELVEPPDTSFVAGSDEPLDDFLSRVVVVFPTEAGLEVVVVMLARCYHLRQSAFFGGCGHGGFSGGPRSCQEVRGGVFWGR